MKNYKIVVSDLDGTLLNSKKEITPEVEELVLSLSENNIFFVPATGRTFHAVPENVANLKGVEYIITSNGACINKIGENKPIYSCYLEHNTVMEVLEIGRKNKVIVEIFAHGNAYCEKNAMDNLEDSGLTEIQINYLRQTRLPIESAVDFAIENKGEIENINILFKDLKLRETICTYLKEKDFAAITSSTTFNLEVTNKLATKGNAVNNLCNLLGIKREEVMAFGDSSNDEDMIIFAGVGVAMGNAEEHIKAKADYVTDTCDNNGFFKGVKRFLK